jgi:lysophospholipase L1-like esterase
MPATPRQDTNPYPAILFLTLLASCASSGPPVGPPVGIPEDSGSGGASGSGPDNTGGSGGAGGAAADAVTIGPADTGVDHPDMRVVDAAPDRAPDSMPAQDGAAAAYNPCPPKGKPCVALPIGDSLTQGAGSSGGGYRRLLFREVVAKGQSITFVGSRASGPAMLEGVPVPFPRNHEGHGGFSIGALSTWITDNNTIGTYKPDIVLLHIGTNNGLRHPGANIPAALNALGDLIDQIVAADPHLLLIVAQLIPSRSDDGVKNTAAFNAGIPAVVAARAMAGKHVVTADIHKFFVANPNWKTDYLPDSDVHPNDAGYDAMGRGWSSALASLLR